VRIPAGARRTEAFPGEEIPAWVRVEAGRTAGWVPARSLIDPVLRAQGGDALALEHHRDGRRHLHHVGRRRGDRRRRRTAGDQGTRKQQGGSTGGGSHGCGLV
ncbi:MAG: hypothetical protein ACKOTD_04840, partial [Phycisphaerales bacterium]